MKYKSIFVLHTLFTNGCWLICWLLTDSKCFNYSARWGCLMRRKVSKQKLFISSESTTVYACTANHYLAKRRKEWYKCTCVCVCNMWMLCWFLNSFCGSIDPTWNDSQQGLILSHQVIISGERYCYYIFFLFLGFLSRQWWLTKALLFHLALREFAGCSSAARSVTVSAVALLF